MDIDTIDNRYRVAVFLFCLAWSISASGFLSAEAEEPVAQPALDVRVVTDEADAVLGLLTKRSLDVAAAARKALAYLPSGSRLRATIYPVLKKKGNSFVFELDSDPAIFMYVSGKASETELANTLAHELHHVGTAAACRASPDGSPVGRVGEVLRWMGGFAEGIAVLAAAGGPDVHPHAGGGTEEWIVWERDAAQFNSDLARIEAFFQKILAGELDTEAQRTGFIELINTEEVPQGPFYTVGWKMAALVEQRFGRQKLIDASCDMRLLLNAYNEIATSPARGDGGSLATWSPELLRALSTGPDETASRVERIQGAIPDGAETVLDRVVHFEPALATEIATSSRWCDRLDLVKRRIEIGGAELHLEEEGSGTPLVLIHGGPGGTHHYFHPWFSRAASFARVLYYDQRGCGLSDFEPGPEGYSVEQAVGDLEALRVARGIERWVLFGYSYGGALAQLYAVDHPERVAGLILHTALPVLRDDLGDSRQQDYLSPEELARKDAVLEELRGLRQERDWSVRRTMQLLVYNWQLNGDWKRQSFFKPTREQIAHTALYEWVHDDDFNALMSRSLEGMDLAGAFDSSSIPTLILEGEWDLTWGERKRDVLMRHHPRARHLVFENAGHSVYREQPEAFFRVLEEFLSGVSQLIAQE